MAVVVMRRKEPRTIYGLIRLSQMQADPAATLVVGPGAFFLGVLLQCQSWVSSSSLAAGQLLTSLAGLLC